MVWPFDLQARRERQAQERKEWKKEQRAKAYAKSPTGKYQTRFRSAMLGAPQPIIDIFIDAEELCNPSGHDEFTIGDFLSLAAAFKDGSIKEQLVSSRGGDADSMAFYSGLTTTFNAVMALLPPSSNGQMTISLKDIDGPIIFQTLRVSLHNVDMATPILGPLVNNQMLFDNLTQARKAPRGKYEITKLLLAGTPFAQLPDLRIPFEVPPAAWCEHALILAQTGGFKTQLIQYLVAEDLEAVADGECSVIVMDSQGDMLPLMKSLKVFAPGEPLEGRLIVIEPHPTYPPALNVFSISKDRLDTYDEYDREQLVNTTIWLITYIVGTIGKSAELTPRQDNVFTFCIELLREIPGATLHTFDELLNAKDLRNFEPYIRKLRPTAQNFLRTSFMDEKLYGDVKRKEVLWRIQTLLKSPTFERMLCAKECKIDLFTELAEGGKVILISTDKRLLQDDQSAAFGRFWLAMIVAACNERAVLYRDDRTPVKVYVDEAHEYIENDHNAVRLLNEARKKNVGLICTTQRCSNITNPKVLDALCDAAIKFVNTPNSHDTHRLAPQMGYDTSPEFLATQPSRCFALHVRKHIPKAVSVEIPFLVMEEEMEKMTREEQDGIMATMRERYCISPSEPLPEPEPEPPPTPKNNPPPDDDDDISEAGTW